MNAVIVLVIVGVALIAGGLYYHLFDNILEDHFLAYVYNTNDPYYLGSQLVWDAIPYVLVILGVLSLLAGGRRYQTSMGGESG